MIFRLSKKAEVDHLCSLLYLVVSPVHLYCIHYLYPDTLLGIFSPYFLGLEQLNSNIEYENGYCYVDYWTLFCWLLMLEETE